METTADTRLEPPTGEISLIYHSGALGDFVTTIPAIACWRRLYPRDRIVCLTRRAHGDLLLQAGLVDTAWDLDESRFARLYAGDGSALASLRPERALLFTRPDSPLVEALHSAGCRRTTVQEPFPSVPRAIVPYHLSLFTDPPPATDLFRPLRTLGLSGEAAPEVSARESGALVIHPGSGGRDKIWPRQRFELVAGVLRQRGRRILWCLGPAERDYRPPPADGVQREAALPELCGILARARCYLGNDSGVSHLAAACGCPCVVLFGPSDDRIWAPSGDAVEIVKPPGETAGTGGSEIRKIGLAQVLAAVDRVEQRAAGFPS
ncbi:MAG: glycosyltransferase family 9 protein [Acidobacteriota bacterium]